jgi:hypothetical protein
VLFFSQKEDPGKRGLSIPVEYPLDWIWHEQHDMRTWMVYARLTAVIKQSLPTDTFNSDRILSGIFNCSGIPWDFK